MSDPRVIQADYASWRPVAGRKVLQLVFEVPIEQTEMVMNMLGVPMPGESRWCAIALLENGGRANESDAGTPRETQKPSSATDTVITLTGTEFSPIIANTAAAGTWEIPKERRPFVSLPLSQQAAMRTNDPVFRRFLAGKDGPSSFLVLDTEMAADEIRHFCGVTSRGHIKENSPSGVKWLQLENRYQSWLTDQRYASVAR